MLLVWFYKKISGDFVKETKTDIVITTNDNLYSIDKDIILFYLAGKEKIPVGKAREKLTPQKIRYNSIVETIDINKENYKEKTKFFKSYKKDAINHDAVYHIYLNDGRSYAGYYRSATIRFIFFKDIGSEKIYKFKKNAIKMIIENDKDVTQDLLDSYDENEKNYSDEANTVYIASLSSGASKESGGYYIKTDKSEFRIFFSYLIFNTHKLHSKEDTSYLNASKGVQVNLEWVSKIKRSQAEGFGFGISWIPYRNIYFEDTEYKYGFLPVYALVHFPILKNSPNMRITLRVGIDFFLADYKSYGSSPMFYFSPAFYYKFGKIALGIGYQYNSGKLNSPLIIQYPFIYHQNDIYVSDKSLYLSLGFGF